MQCCAKAIIDVAVVKFRFGAVEFVEKLLFDEADKRVSITRTHFSVHSDSINLFVIVTRVGEVFFNFAVKRIRGQCAK